MRNTDVAYTQMEENEMEENVLELEEEEEDSNECLDEDDRYSLSPIYGLILQGNARWGKIL